MSFTHKVSTQDILNQIASLINQKYPLEQADLISQYLRQLMLSVTTEDLQSKTIEDHLACLMNNWQFINTKNNRSVRVYNPELNKNGWESNYTVVEVNALAKPFLVDSIRLAIQKLDIDIHLLANINNLVVTRNNDYKIIKIYNIEHNLNLHDAKNSCECSIYMEIEKHINSKDQQQIIDAVERVIEEVNHVVEDWKNLRIKAESVLMYINKVQRYSNFTQLQVDQLNEVYAFMHWLTSNHFTFLGYAEFDFEQKDNVCKLKYIEDSGLGIIFNNKTQDFILEFGLLNPAVAELYLNDEVILLGKSNVVSRVHRPANIDLVSIKIFDEKFKLTKELRFFGLYTSSAYTFNLLEIPYIKTKIKNVLKSYNLVEDSHDGRRFLNIIDNIPRDEVFQATVEDLSELAINIINMKDRPKIKMMARRDRFFRYFSCFVYIPRETYDSTLRKKIQAILLQEFLGVSASFYTSFNESILARIHFIIRVNPQEQIDTINFINIEQKIIEVAKTWFDRLFNALKQVDGEEGTVVLFDKFENAFGVFYQECFSPSTAVVDIGYLQRISKESDVEIDLYRACDDHENIVRLKLFGKDKTITLSDVVPVLENIGFKVVNERPYKIASKEGNYSINDYKLIAPPQSAINLDNVKNVVIDVLKAVLTNVIDNDRFNKLALVAKQGYHDIKILRAYYKYLWQAGFSISQNFVEDALTVNFEIAKKLINFFHIKFSPELDDHLPAKNENLDKLRENILSDLEKVESLGHDKIIRTYLEVIDATVRTNFFQRDFAGNIKNYLSLKIESAKISILLLPKPKFEIFVYATHCEGIHLRASDIARGGIRWSDRFEDYRTEILGLMKAQQVKNAVIVPLGAKGGFIVKNDLTGLDKNQQSEIVITSYKTLIQGMLDLTDNLINNMPLTPVNVVAWDKPDPYLVVAADKGTAKFSDIANALSEQYNFWLTDAFASGGSQGYDHKKIAITSKGVFESVKSHFNTLGVDLENTPITVMGIGDMNGDVFGNGLLLCRNFKLIAAFNHMHIFLDPNPDLSKAFKERSRLFNLDYSTWEDYNPKVISAGGGVFKRSEKKIKISEEVKKLFEITEDQLEPSHLIKVILQSSVDLFWNGGIGTFIKASNESHAMVSDRNNDNIRIDGKQLRAKVVAEGGNLGFTQLGRVEYAKNGGIINTDALDNSAGVNCSDFEVNIKILLQAVMRDGLLTISQRNELLVKMQNEVVNLVLTNNRSQNEAVTQASIAAPKNLKMHTKLMHDLENNTNLNRNVEFLPSTEEIETRQNQGIGFTRPELCVLLAYTKTQLKSKLLASNLPEEKFNEQQLFNYFPKLLHKDYATYMLTHSLKRQIIATKLVNKVVDEMGLTFVNRLYDETGASEEVIIRCYLIANNVFAADNLRLEINAQAKPVSVGEKIEMNYRINRFIRHVTRWLIQHHVANVKIEDAIERFLPAVKLLQEKLPIMLSEKQNKKYQEIIKNYLSLGMDESLAKGLAQLDYLFCALDITDIILSNKFDSILVAKTYFAVGSYLKLNWFREAILQQSVTNNWDALARSAFRDDVDRQQCTITVCILKSNIEKNIAEQQVKEWFADHESMVTRWKFLINNLKATTTDFTMFAVALRELLNLSYSITYSV